VHRYLYEIDTKLTDEKHGDDHNANHDWDPFGVHARVNDHSIQAHSGLQEQ